MADRPGPRAVRRIETQRVSSEHLPACAAVKTCHRHTHVVLNAFTSAADQRTECVLSGNTEAGQAERRRWASGRRLRRGLRGIVNSRRPEEITVTLLHHADFNGQPPPSARPRLH